MSIQSTADVALVSEGFNPSAQVEQSPEPGFVGLLAFARTLHAYRLRHDQKYRLEPARIRLEEERAEAARQTSAPEGAL